MELSLHTLHSRELLNHLAQALQARLDVIANHDLRNRDTATHLKKLQEASESIEHCVALLPTEIDPHLRHYLERRSYDKALAWIKEGIIGKHA